MKHTHIHLDKTYTHTLRKKHTHIHLEKNILHTLPVSGNPKFKETDSVNFVQSSLATHTL